MRGQVILGHGREGTENGSPGRGALEACAVSFGVAYIIFSDCGPVRVRRGRKCQRFEGRTGRETIGNRVGERTEMGNIE